MTPLQRFLSDFREYVHKQDATDVRVELRQEIARADRSLHTLRQQGLLRGCYLVGRVRHGVTQIEKGGIA